MKADRIKIVYHVMSPYIAKADVIVLRGKYIITRFPMRDDDAAKAWAADRFPGLPVSVTITD